MAILIKPSWADEYRLSIGETKTGGISAIAVNGQIPGPILRFREGEDVVIHVTNTLQVISSIHWHGLLVPAAMDGVPGLGGFHGIRPGETFTYRFTIRQSGTYWYHAHSEFQEQAGLYGPIVITPKEPDSFRYDRDYVVMLSDRAGDDPKAIFHNLKADAGYYNHARRTVADFFHDARKDGLGATVKDRLDWGAMRMDPTDLSDVTGYTFLVNGKDAAANETLLFKPGERVRLRIINGGAMSFFDVRVPGLMMTVVAADGQNVEPTAVDEFRISPAETYDVIVRPREDKAFTLFAQSLDRTGYALATLAPREGMTGQIPLLYPRTRLTMSDMGVGMPAMDMSHDMAGMDMSHGMADMPDTDNEPSGWAGGYPAGEKVLSYADLKAATPNANVRAPDREIVLHLTGNMERFVWTINGKKFEEAPPVRVAYGERVKLTFINDTMMAHPMHLHGMFVELDNGQDAATRPRKHTVSVPPGKTISALLTVNEPGEWAFHCHLLYHMAAGMMTSLSVTPSTVPSL